jgi:hypothetical protein
MRVASSRLIASVAIAAFGCSGDGGKNAPSLSLSKWLGGSPPAPASAPPPVSPAEAAVRIVPVSLSGEVAAVEPPSGERLYARAARTWVHERPSEDSPRIGYLRAGSSVRVTGDVAGTAGCPEGFRPIAPRGYVCLGSAATLDEHDPIVAALSAHPPDYRRKLPYIYGTVRKPGPVYVRLPTEDELRETEPELPKRMEKWLDADGEIGAGYAQYVWLGGPGTVPDPREAWRSRRTEGVPAFLLGGKSAPNVLAKPRDPDQLVIGRMRPKVGYSFTETFLWQGRRYGVTPELEIVATDRLRPIQGSDFHGVEIGKGLAFPFALVREPGAHYVLYQRSTNSLVEGEVAPYREAVPLTGRQQFFHDVLHYETKDGKWLSDRDASRLDPAKKLPGWALKGEKWIDVNITKQAMILYDGTRPVYATLISSGEAGLEDPEHTTATKRGIFRIHAKHVATTMASDEVGEEFELRDVPYVQYFDDDGHAIHGAYWHDKFGIPKSHGCINLAPEDARRVFFWTEPYVAPGWHGALEPLKGTVVFIHP